MMTLPVLTKEFHREAENQPFNNFPEKVMQIGDGNFIRGFIDWMICQMNLKSGFDGRIVSVQATPRGKTVPKLNKQDGLFTLVQRGMENGKIVDEKLVVDSISRSVNPYTDWEAVLKAVENPSLEFLFSNTTEAGIRYEKEDYQEGASPLSFPGKVLAMLYHRYIHFNGEMDKGWIILPCELIENNGDRLKTVCMQIAEDWNLSSAFLQWFNEACIFCNTLVDRIVPGFPKEEAGEFFSRLGYQDELLTVAEPYHLFVIEGPAGIEKKLPFKEAGLNVHFSAVAPYRELKVKLLNAPHTMMAMSGLQMGIETVREGIEHPALSAFIRSALQEDIYATLSPDEQSKAKAYIDQVFDRFANPFLQHRLADISLNSFSKFQARLWPSIRNYREKKQENPRRLVVAFASFLLFYSKLQEQEAFKITDDPKVIDKFRTFYHEFDGSKAMLVELSRSIIQEEFSRGSEDLTDLYEAIADAYLQIKKQGMENTLIQLEKEANI
jgi:tagaturonate reductase